MSSQKPATGFWEDFNAAVMTVVLIVAYALALYLGSQN